MAARPMCGSPPAEGGSPTPSRPGGRPLRLLCWNVHPDQNAPGSPKRSTPSRLRSTSSTHRGDRRVEGAGGSRAAASPQLCCSICALRRFAWVARPPLLPAARASSLVNSCAVPAVCAAFPPFRAISLTSLRSIAAKPRGLLGLAGSASSTERGGGFCRQLAVRRAQFLRFLGIRSRIFRAAAAHLVCPFDAPLLRDRCPSPSFDSRRCSFVSEAPLTFYVRVWRSFCPPP